MPHPDERASHRLLVEGPDDLQFVRALWKLRHEDRTFWIEVKQGTSSLLKGIRGEIESEERTAVGIMIDANGDVRTRWEEIRQRLTTVDIIGIPKNPASGGSIMMTNGQTRIGVWIMPDNISAGSLENMIEHMINDDKISQLSRDFISDAQAVTQVRYTPSKRKKAEVRAWLATQAEPGRIEYAIEHGILDVDGELLERFCSWLEQRFKED